MDAHVHLHRLGPPEDVFAAAARNFRLAADALGLPSTGPGVLFWAETARGHRFHELAERVEDPTWRPGPRPVTVPDRDTPGAPRRAPDGWVLTRTAERGSLLVIRHERVELVLIGGRQVVTREGLEVLVFGPGAGVDPEARATEEGEIQAGQLAARPRLEQILEQSAGERAITILPWGLGKWWLRRGRNIRRALESGRWRLFVGDTVHRPAGVPEPRLLRLARARGAPILPGSDPLPFRWQYREVARYGFVHNAPLALERPAAAISARLLRDGRQPVHFGGPGSWNDFLRNQAALQFRKWTGTRGTGARK